MVMRPVFAAMEDALALLLDNNTANSSAPYSGNLTVPHYPSGYTLPQIVLASIIVTIVMIIVVVGNMLVIIAITTEKALKNIQNWFIASLAVADFFLGLIIMPFSLANELMGYWIFGSWWCDIHSAMDVLLCTASIMNLCLISLDRYWSITQAVEYLKKRTPVRAIVMIGAVWILSALICIPPLLGWKVDRPAEEQYPRCQLSEELGYVVYSALGSFYIPSCIMVFVYIRIYYAAKARARRGIRKAPKKQQQQPQNAITSFTNTTAEAKKCGEETAVGGGSFHQNNNSSPQESESQIATIESHRPVAIPTVTCDLASDISTSDGGDIIAEAHAHKDTLKVCAPPDLSRSSIEHCTLRSSSLSVNGELQQQQDQQPQQHQLQVTIPRNRLPSIGIDTDMVSEFDPSSSDSGVVARCTVVKPLKLRLCKPIFGRKSCSKKSQSANGHKIVTVGGGGGGGGGEQEEQQQIVPRVQKPRDPERERRRIARKKEKRATLILGLIMGSFIACWLPFFFLYILRLAYPVPEMALSTVFWLGYMNSALNPVIYTIFNKDFRRAFRRILFK